MLLGNHFFTIAYG